MCRMCRRQRLPGTLCRVRLCRGLARETGRGEAAAKVEPGTRGSPRPSDFRIRGRRRARRRMGRPLFPVNRR